VLIPAIILILIGGVSKLLDIVDPMDDLDAQMKKQNHPGQQMMIAPVQNQQQQPGFVN